LVIVGDSMRHGLPAGTNRNKSVANRHENCIKLDIDNFFKGGFET